MTAFLLRRILSFIPMILGITFLVFFLMNIAPGDFLDEMRASRDISAETIKAKEAELGLDRPWVVRYFVWLSNLLLLDFGDSWAYKVPVEQLLWQRVPATLVLSLTSILFAWIIAIPLGVLAAMYKDSLFDRASAALAYAALSLPEFFLALLAVYFAGVTGWFPVEGRTSITHEFMSPTEQFFDYANHLILPTLVLGIGSIAGIMRIMRANFLDSSRSDYVTTARAKGLSETTIMFRHVLPNAINPLLSAFGFTLAGLLSGALLVENVMNYPGLGQLVFQSIIKEDQFVVMGAVLMGSLMLMWGNIMADILLALLDPRIRIEKS